MLRVLPFDDGFGVVAVGSFLDLRGESLKSTRDFAAKRCKSGNMGCRKRHSLCPARE